MIDNRYLYGTDDVPHIPKEITENRILLLNENLTTIVTNNEVGNDRQIIDIQKAIKFWTILGGENG